MYHILRAACATICLLGCGDPPGGLLVAESKCVPAHKCDDCDPCTADQVSADGCYNTPLGPKFGCVVDCSDPENDGAECAEMPVSTCEGGLCRPVW